MVAIVSSCFFQDRRDGEESQGRKKGEEPFYIIFLNEESKSFLLPSDIYLFLVSIIRSSNRLLGLKSKDLFSF